MELKTSSEKIKKYLRYKLRLFLLFGVCMPAICWLTPTIIGNVVASEFLYRLRSSILVLWVPILVFLIGNLLFSIEATGSQRLHLFPETIIYSYAFQAVMRRVHKVVAIKNIQSYSLTKTTLVIKGMVEPEGQGNSGKVKTIKIPRIFEEEQPLIEYFNKQTS